jgi:hypothetical protein
MLQWAEMKHSVNDSTPLKRSEIRCGCSNAVQFYRNLEACNFVPGTIAKPITQFNLVLVFIAGKIYDPLPPADAYLTTADTSTEMSTAVCFLLTSYKEFRMPHKEELCNSYESASRSVVRVLKSRRLLSDVVVAQMRIEQIESSTDSGKLED